MASSVSLAPDYIRFLFSSRPNFDCYFEVGSVTKGKVVRIGAVKLMLMAHSEVFRAGFQYETSDISIKDVHPNTFKGMLRYVYGNDTTSVMDFDEADDLFYVANKYMMKSFKDKLAARLMKLLNADNICALLNNPAWHTHLELETAIIDILRYETHRVLESPVFLWMNADGILRILEQDGVSVTEIKLWRAAIRWAKLRANSEDGQQVRQQLSGLTQHLRPCALTMEQIRGEIADTQVLTREEMSIVCLSVERKEKPNNLQHFSNDIEPRKLLERVKVYHELLLKQLDHVAFCEEEIYIFTLLIKKNSIELLGLVCKSKDRDRFTPENVKSYRVSGTTTITKVTTPSDPDSSSAFKPSVSANFRYLVKFGVEFEIPLFFDGNFITLQPGIKYRVKIVLNGWHRKYSSEAYGGGSYGDDNLTLDLHNIYPGDYCRYEFPSTMLQYRVYTTAAYTPEVGANRN